VLAVGVLPDVDFGVIERAEADVTPFARQRGIAASAIGDEARDAQTGTRPDDGDGRVLHGGGPAHPLCAVIVAVGVFAALTVVNQALIGVFGRNGGLIASGAVALVQITTLSAVAPPDSLDGAFAALRPIMPLSAADTVMRWAVLGLSAVPVEPSSACVEVVV